MKVSVIVAVYNVGAYLEKCISSIRNQTYRNLEIILVDDGSTDESSQICDKHASADYRVRVIHKPNGGIVSARKAGIAVATGEYVLTVDGDDWIELEHIEILATHAINSKADMIYMAGWYKDTERGSQYQKEDLKEKVYEGIEINREFWPFVIDKDKYFKLNIKRGLPRWAIKRNNLSEKISLIDNRIQIAEDFMCVWFCLLDAHKIAVIQNSGYHYFQRMSSITHTRRNISDLSLQIFYREFLIYLLNRNCSVEIMRCFYYVVTETLLVTRYECFLAENEYLFPYKEVKRGSRIALYGAGEFGKTIYGAVQNRDYAVTVWVDKNATQCSNENVDIRPIEELKNYEYDYIVVAIIQADTAKVVRDELTAMGIDEKKIALMSVDVINEEHIPSLFRQEV